MEQGESANLIVFYRFPLTTKNIARTHWEKSEREKRNGRDATKKLNSNIKYWPQMCQLSLLISDVWKNFHFSEVTQTGPQDKGMRLCTFAMLICHCFVTLFCLQAFVHKLVNKIAHNLCFQCRVSSTRVPG